MLLPILKLVLLHRIGGYPVHRIDRPVKYNDENATFIHAKSDFRYNILRMNIVDVLRGGGRVRAIKGVGLWKRRGRYTAWQQTPRKYKANTYFLASAIPECRATQ